MKASAVSKDLRTPKYRMRVEKSKKLYERDSVSVQDEIVQLLQEDIHAAHTFGILDSLNK